MNTITLTITEQHLDKAIKARQRRADGYDLTRDCVFGQAAQEVFGADLDGTSNVAVHLMNGDKFYVPASVSRMVNAFDLHDHDLVRLMLPLTATLSREDA